MLVGAILDKAQTFLHDDGIIWSRAQLLDWLNDGYRQLLAQSHAVVRPFQIDVPGRTAWAASQEWEDRHGQGTFRQFAYHSHAGEVSCCFKWESQHLEGVAVEPSLDATTQMWEIVHTSDFEQHCRLVLSKQHERPIKVYHDDKRLLGASAKEMDTLRDRKSVV